jgi:hypothetical protein
MDGQDPGNPTEPTVPLNRPLHAGISLAGRSDCSSLLSALEEPGRPGQAWGTRLEALKCPRDCTLAWWPQRSWPKVAW